ncbi:NusG domain II-containing protein [Jeongeupia naejangsanensis]|uniref:NusG domain II-containing protein n=2 Tax=Jeongeupia naejangsanensis TaxID=613195 RepID=A0ABS2BLX1_9NEIS|nr:NusG domain II-containing protein [Jeongeupia naejangsanensis]
MLVLGLALVAASALWGWQGGNATRVRIWQGGKVYAEVDLAATRTLKVPGPLGDTVIEIAAGKARIAADPSPRQYCVREGWLTQAGEAAICLPNRTSFELLGAGGRGFDSLSY